MRNRFGPVMLVIGLVLTACSSAPPTGPEAGLALIDQAAVAFGGWPALDAVTSQEILTGGGDWEPLQSVEPGGDPRQINTFGQTILVDYENKRMRVDFDAKRVYPNAAPVRFKEIIDGDVAMLESTDAAGVVTTERLHPSRYAARMRDFNRLPVRLLYTAKNAPDVRREADILGEGSTTHVLKYTDSGLPVEVHFDSFNDLPIRVIYMEDDPLYGDSLNEVVFSDWKDVGGVRLPQTISTFLNGDKLREERMRTLINNSPQVVDAVFAIPEEIRTQTENGERVVSQWTLRRAVMGTAFADFAREQQVSFVEVAPGVHHITGGSHHSMVIEMTDGLMVVEMPLFEERSVAVIRALEEKFPGKPIKYGVITHFHMDHSGGIRAYAAKGVTLLAHESIVPWVNEILARPKTIRPDSLAAAGVAAFNVEGIGESRTIMDGARTIELRSVPNAHSAGLLTVYLPVEKVVFVSDLYSPGNAVQPGDPNAYSFYTAIVNGNMQVDRIVGGHGGIGSFRDLARLMTTPSD